MAGLKKLVLDVLKPSEPSIVDMVKKLCELEGVEGVEITVREIDRRVETVKITIEGDNLNFDKINSALDRYGATIHSIDKVSGGKKLIAGA
ncbi:putative ArCR [Candidatus Burarchaeum australiense]|nr:putative ArCR [Candidatus Burarchaeum australiense]